MVAAEHAAEAAVSAHLAGADPMQLRKLEARWGVRDLVGDRDHWSARVVSEAFRGKTRVQQHQMIYQALQGRMGEQLHALALQTSAPEDG